MWNEGCPEVAHTDMENKLEGLWGLAGRLLLSGRDKINRARKYPPDSMTHISLWTDGVSTVTAAKSMLVWLREARS